MRSTLGTKTAYKAVAKPVEGTILTVIREASAAAVAAAERDNNVETVLAATLDAAERAVAKTPSLLPVLREAHVVDSGGQGLFRLFQGALAAARGRPLEPGEAVRHPASVPPHAAVHAPQPGPEPAPGAEEGEFGYETVYLLRARAGIPLDVPAIQAHLESIGDSVLVAGDGLLAKVHVHNDRPDAVIAYGLTVGTLSRITIENLDSQAHDVRESKAAAFVGAGAGDGALTGGRRRRAWRPPKPATRLALGVVVVAPSDGLAAVLTDTATPFREHGAFRVVSGGQSANPSTGELLEAVEATDADELLILSNNPNVVLAARQVASMTKRKISVVPTRNCAEGVAALFELDPSQDAEANAAADDRRRPRHPDDAGHRGRARRDGVRAQGEEGPDDRARPGRRPARGRQRPAEGGHGGARPPRAGLRPADDLLRRDRDARRGGDARAQGARGQPRASTSR